MNIGNNIINTCKILKPNHNTITNNNCGYDTNNKFKRKTSTANNTNNNNFESQYIDNPYKNHNSTIEKNVQTKTQTDGRTGKCIEKLEPKQKYKNKNSK